MKPLARLFVVGAALWVPASRAAPPSVRFEQGRLTADLQDVELADVLGEIASKAGFEVRGTPKPQHLTIRLDAVPLAEAVSRLLEGQSVSSTYDRGGALKGVQFYDLSTAPAWRPPSSGDQTAAPGVGDADTVAASARPVPIDGLLAEALGSDQSTFSQIVGVALQVGDARLRMDALRVGLRLLAAEPDLRAEVSQTLDANDEVASAAWLERIAGANAGEIARQTARLAHWKPLRRRAAAVMRIIRGGG